MTTTTITGASILGYVHSGGQPVINADIQLYVTGEGVGKLSTPMLSEPISSDADGYFRISNYSCPSALSQVYLVARGGALELQPYSSNVEGMLVAALGNCNDLVTMTNVEASELTTVAAVSALAPFMQSVASVGAVPADVNRLRNAFTSAKALTNILERVNADPPSPESRPDSIPRLMTLANIISACTRTAAGSLGGNNTCNKLLSYAQAQQGSAPSNTVDALLEISRNPAHNVVPIYSLSPASPYYQPVLATAPADWTMDCDTVPEPVFSPLPGTYNGSQTITLTDDASGAWIFYNTGATWRQYTGAFTLPSSATIQAIAFAHGLSLLAMGTYNIVPPELSVFAPSTSIAGEVETGTIALNVAAPKGGIVMDVISSAPAIATVSPSTVTVAPGQGSASFTYTGLIPGTTTLSASAIGFASGSATITVVPPVSVTVTPKSATLSAQQTQQFTTTVSGSSNTAVTWSISPALGTISTTGLYTPPATISADQNVSVTATSLADPTKVGLSSVSLLPASTGHTYYLSSSGKDASSGLSSDAAWLTPNHQGLLCGDTIIAAPGNYNAMTITASPSCSTHNAVWVKCATFDGCKINQDVWSQGGIDVQASYWAFFGWEVTAKTGPYASCFSAIPSNSATSSIHDIYFINDIANGCMAGGFIAANTNSYSVDYFVAVADIVYNTAQGSAYCYSGVSVLQPLATDTATGTHIYISQIFAWQNLEPAICNGGQSTDGEGIILDTFTGTYAGFKPYSQQSVIENIIAVYNGAFGILAGGGSGNSNSPMTVRNATTYGNFINTTQNQTLCAQMASYGWPTTNAANANRYTTFTSNLAVSRAAHLSGCGNNTPYAYYFGNIDGTDTFSGNAGYSVSGQSIGYTGLTTGFLKGSNLVGTDPALANPIEPPAPSCSGKASVIDCMSSVIAAFSPTNVAYTSYGYQPPSSTPIYNPLFPKWLCGNGNMPTGLVSMGCLKTP